jgi:hypothetical protein
MVISEIAESRNPKARLLGNVAHVLKNASVFAGPLMAASISILVFFNYLFFLKWSPLTESRWWPLLILILTFPIALIGAGKLKCCQLSFWSIVVFCAVVTISYFLKQNVHYNPTYLVGFLLSSIPFFLLGAIAGHWPRAMSSIFVIFTISLFVAIIGAYLTYGGLWDAGGFRDILSIPQRLGRPSFRSYYQLVSLGLAIGAIATWALFGKDAPGWAHHLFGVIIVLVVSQTGSRGAYLLFVLGHVLLVLKTRSRGDAVRATLLMAITTLLIVLLLPDSATLRRAQYTNEFGTGVPGFEETTITRGMLYGRALSGWMENGASLVLGRGFGSYSLDVAGVYPDWVLHPAKGSIYPHNVILEAGYELGILGVIPMVIAFGWPFCRLVFTSWESASRSEIAVAMIFIMHCGLAMISAAIGYDYSLYFLLGAASVSSIPHRSAGKDGLTAVSAGPRTLPEARA